MSYLALLFVKSSQDLLDRVNLSSLLRSEDQKPQNIDFNTKFKRGTNRLIKARNLVATALKKKYTPTFL